MINNIFTQIVLLLSERGFITLDVEYIYGTKIESKANKYTFVWRKTVEKNRAKLHEKIRFLLQQVDDMIAQDKAAASGKVEFTPRSPDNPYRTGKKKGHGIYGNKRTRLRAQKEGAS